MREFRVHPSWEDFPADRSVWRLQFHPTGTRLAVWLGSPAQGTDVRGRPECNDISDYDLESGAYRSLTEGTIAARGGLAGVAALSPDFRYLAAPFEDYYGDSPERVWAYDLSSPDRPLPWLSVGERPIGPLAFSPSGTALVMGRSTGAWNRPTSDVIRIPFDEVLGTPVRYRETFNMFNGKSELGPDPPWLDLAERVAGVPDRYQVCALSVSADGRKVAVGTQGAVHVLDVKARRRVRSLPTVARNQKAKPVWRVGFDPAGGRLAAVTGGRVFAHPLTTRAGTTWRTTPSLGYVHDCDFHPTGHALAAVNEAGVAHFLDPATGAVRRSFQWGMGPLYAVAFAPDGMTCAAGGKDGRVVIWDVDE